MGWSWPRPTRRSRACTTSRDAIGPSVCLSSRSARAGCTSTNRTRRGAGRWGALPAGRAGAADARGGGRAEAARALGATVRTGVRVTVPRLARGRLVGVVRRRDVRRRSRRQRGRRLGGELSAMARRTRAGAAPARVHPRHRAAAPMIRHKVYAAEYVGNIASSDADLQTSAVVEGTPIRHHPDRREPRARRLRPPISAAGPAAGWPLRRCALFPVLAGVHVMRAYRGFRPYCPDHLPVIGPDPRVPGLCTRAVTRVPASGWRPRPASSIARCLTGAPPPTRPAPVRARAIRGAA